MRAALERYFEFEQLGTNWRTEILAGVTTFVTMAYIIFVNPSILAEAGMPFAAVMAATCLSSAIGCLLMGFVARYPIALAPGMGLNAYFTYTVVQGMGVPWEVALGAVFISGIAFLVLTSVAFSLFGFIIGIWADNFEKLQFVPLLIVTPLTFLGGSFYSIDMLPPFWQTVTLFNPVVYLISGFRWSFFEISDVNVGISLAMALAFLGLCLTTIWWIFRTGYRLKN